MVAAGIFGFFAAPVAAGAALTAAGFGAGGVIGGSIAAGVHSTIGNVAAGSAFAAGQSAGAVGIAGTTAAAVGGAVASAVEYVSENPVKSAGFAITSAVFNMFVWPVLGAYVGEWLEESLFADDDQE